MMSIARKRVVLADNHPIVLAGIKALIESAPDFELVGEATDGLSAFDLILTKRPDVAVVDLSMPGMNGAELVRRLTEKCPTVVALVLTVQEEPAYVHQLLRAGARLCIETIRVGGAASCPEGDRCQRCLYRSGRCCQDARGRNQIGVDNRRAERAGDRGPQVCCARIEQQGNCSSSRSQREDH